MSGCLQWHFACQCIKNPWTVTKKLSCHLRISKRLIALLLWFLINTSFRIRPKVGFGCFERHLHPPVLTPQVLEIYIVFLVLGALCTAAWCSGSGSVPSEIAEPTYGAQSCGCVFIKALQSKDFSEILLICVNFLVPVHGSACFLRQNYYWLSGHDIRNIMSGVILGVREVLVIIQYQDIFGRKGKICNTYWSQMTIRISQIF